MFKKARFLILLFGIIPSLLSILVPKKRNRIVFNSTLNTNYNFNSKYLFEYFLAHHPEYEVLFVMNDAKKRARLSAELGPHFVDTSTLRGMCKALRAACWVCSTLETPVGGIFQRYARFVIHLGHGTPLKNIGYLEKNFGFVKGLYYLIVTTNFSAVLSTSDDYVPVMMRFMRVGKERIVVNGQPRNDFFFVKRKGAKPEFLSQKAQKHVLYAPTWRPYADTILFPFDDFDVKKLAKQLKKTNTMIYLRLHPYHEKNLSGELLNCENIRLLGSSVVGDITQYLPDFDLLITDYSSIFIDFLLCHKPLIFFDYDLERYEKEIGFTVDYKSHTPGPHPLTMAEALSEMEKLLTDEKYFSKERKTVSKKFNSVQKPSCASLAELIRTKINPRRFHDKHEE